MAFQGLACAAFRMWCAYLRLVLLGLSVGIHLIIFGCMFSCCSNGISLFVRLGLVEFIMLCFLRLSAVVLCACYMRVVHCGKHKWRLFAFVCACVLFGFLFCRL